LNEFSTTESPKIPLYYYINTSVIGSPSITVNNKVYSYSDTDSFIDALNDRNKIPMWAYYNFAENQIKIEGLSKVLEFDQSLPSNDYSMKFINVPQTLPAGYYMIDSNCQGIEFQTFFQVTDIGMYIIKSNEKSLIWLNDLSSKTSIIGAEIVNTNLNLQYTTNSDGVAFFDTPAFVAEDELNPYDDTAYLKITATDGKTAVMKYSFYSYNYRWGQDKDMYWNYLFMDRSIYKPDDTVSLWGMAKNRYSGKNIENVTVEISQGYGYGRYYDTYMNSENSLGVKSSSSFIGNDAPFYYNSYDSEPILSETLSVENGIYKGSLELPSPEQGNYRVVVKDGDTIISNSYITVKNYSKPTYNLTVKGNKEAMFLGETVNFEIKASFFEGTGLPKLPVKITVTDSFGNMGTSYTKNTNSKGIVTFAYTPSLMAGSQGIGYATISVSTSDPEIGEISDNAYVRVIQ